MRLSRSHNLTFLQSQIIHLRRDFNETIEVLDRTLDLFLEHLHTHDLINGLMSSSDADTGPGLGDITHTSGESHATVDAINSAMRAGENSLSKETDAT
jgi:hypothetical protein